MVVFLELKGKIIEPADEVSQLREKPGAGGTVSVAGRTVLGQ
jgi:hypothetical protein